MTPDDLLSRVLYRDGLILVIDKPAGLPVHAGPGGGPNLEELFDVLRFGLPKPPALAHRLDRDTSGCLVLGRHRKALARLGRLFSQGLVEKVYWAVTQGIPPEPQGRIDLPLAKRTTRNGGWRMVVDAKAGLPAVTDYRLLGVSEGREIAWLELRPHTGRTHQVRVHGAALGCPLLGDPVYGGSGAEDEGTSPPLLHLLARSLVLPLRQGKPPVRVTAEPPPHMREALRRCGCQD